MEQQDKHDRFFKASKIVDEAGDFLKKMGFKNQEIYNINVAFLGLSLAEARTIEQQKKQAWTTVKSLFNDYGVSMIEKGLQYAKDHNFNDKKMVAICKKYKTRWAFFNNEMYDSLLASFLTYAVIGFKEGKV